MKESNIKKVKKPKIEEVIKPRGYDRQLPVDKIIGAAVHPSGEKMYLVKWQFCDEFDMVPGNLVREKSPEALLLFFQETCPYQKKALSRTRELPQSLRVEKDVQSMEVDEPLPPPPPADVSFSNEIPDIEIPIE